MNNYAVNIQNNGQMIPVAGALLMDPASGTTPAPNYGINFQVNGQKAPVFAMIVIDPATGLPATLGAGGGGGTPGGADKQVQFNDGGAFGGDSGFTFDKVKKAIALAGAVLTASTPVLDLTQGWNNAAVSFTGLKLNVTNTASAAGSLLLDLQVGGVSQFKTYKDGTLEIPYTSSGYSVGNVKAASGYASLGQSGIYINSSARVGWSSSTGNVGAGVDTAITRLAAASLAIGNGTAGDYSGTLRAAALTLTGATVTTSTPLLDLSQTWNAGAEAFSALKLNVTDTASASGSLLLDLRVGGGSQFKTYKDGTLEIPYTSSGYSVGNVKAASGYAALGQSGISINSSARVGWSSTTGNVGAGVDTGITRLGAASLAIGNGTAGDVSATLSFARGDFYNFRADASNYERGSLYWSANYLWLTTAQAGTGAARGMVIATQGDQNIYFKIDGTDRMNVSSSGVTVWGGMQAIDGFLMNTGDRVNGIGSGIITVSDNGTTKGFIKTIATTYSGLPAPATAGNGARGMITDANVNTFGATVSSGGGSYKMPVWCDGTAWYVG